MILDFNGYLFDSNSCTWLAEHGIIAPSEKDGACFHTQKLSGRHRTRIKLIELGEAYCRKAPRTANKEEIKNILTQAYTIYH